MSTASFLFLSLFLSLTLNRNVLSPPLSRLVVHLAVPTFPLLVSHFLHDQLHPASSSEVPPPLWPVYSGSISVFHSTTVMYHSPSESTKAFNVCCKIIRVCPNWQKKKAQYDCIVVATLANAQLHLARPWETRPNWC